MGRPRHPLRALIAMLVFLTLWSAFGAVGLYLTLQEWQVARGVGAWRTTAGRIDEARITRGSRGGVRAHIRYSYSVDGRQHESSRAAFLQGVFGSPRERVQQYDEGQRVTVYYDAAAPEEAVLDPSPRTWAFVVMTAVLVLWIVLAVWLGRAMWRAYRAEPSAMA